MGVLPMRHAVRVLAVTMLFVVGVYVLPAPAGWFPDPAALAATRGVSVFVPVREQSAGHGIVIRDIHVEPAESIAESPSVILKFDVHNESETSVTGIVLSVSLLGAVAGNESESRPVLVRPFKVKIDEPLHAGFSFEYEMRLRNVPFDRDSVPDIRVIAARSLTEDVL